MEYFQLQKAVFNHLLEKHKQDSSFTFSVRQMAKKGAEKNHFIGTIKSRYFGFTCWDIPVYFPGSSSDLTNFIFSLNEDRCRLKFQYTMTKSATDLQSKGDLEFGYVLLKNLQTAGIKVFPNEEKHKQLYFHVELQPDGYNNEKEVLQGFEELYSLVAPVVDTSVEEVRSSNPSWQAGRYTNDKFNTLIEKMHQRIQRFATATPQELAQLPEEDDESEPTPVTPKLNLSYPLNTILYGPPGTGKTYHTVNKAVAIANPDFNVAGSSRQALKDEYNRLVAAGQIQFVTFHQSLSYEDFIEGIKPVQPKQDDKYLKYEVQDGIFKRMVEQAAYVPDVQEASVYLTEEEFGKATFYSLTLATATQPGDKDIYRYCIEQNCIALNVAEGFDASGKTEGEIKSQARHFPSGEGAALARLVHHLKVGNYVLLCDGDSTCRAIGRVTGDYQFRPNDQITPDHFRSVEWLVKDVQIPREQLYSSPFAYGLERLDRSDVKSEFFTKSTVPTKPALERRNYVLIIDEINRGNVSQIFGELITLIEEDKRKGPGREEALSVTLPYTKKPFSVPDNLYVIGTMNTADRSVEALDTALRRRFQFEEMMPKPELLNSHQRLKDLWVKYKHTYAGDKEWEDAEKAFMELFGMSFINKDGYEDLKPADANIDANLARVAADDFKAVVSFSGVDLQRMLETLNARLEVLLSKDHTIGHAWLMNVFSLADLQAAFKNKIVPLLQEYFYNNYNKIGLVLGDAFFEKQESVSTKLFASFKTGEDIVGDYSDKIIYRFKDTSVLTIQDFQSIYQ